MNVMNQTYPVNNNVKGETMYRYTVLSVKRNGHTDKTFYEFHASKGKATKQAERLAAQHKGHKFTVAAIKL